MGRKQQRTRKPHTQCYVDFPKSLSPSMRYRAMLNRSQASGLYLKGSYYFSLALRIRAPLETPPTHCLGLQAPLSAMAAHRLELRAHPHGRADELVQVVGEGKDHEQALLDGGRVVGPPDEAGAGVPGRAALVVGYGGVPGCVAGMERQGVWRALRICFEL